MTRLSILLICLLCPLGSAASAQEAQPGKLTVEPYKLRTYDGREREAEMCRLWAPENRDSRARQRLIQLAFVRLRSTAKEPGPPIIYLAGGPGIPGIAMGQIPVYFALFERLREVADVILLDQRGTGMSSPSLNCPAPASSAPPDILADETRAVQHFAGSLQACAGQLRAQGIELAAYTPNAVADDVEDLRRALGVEKVSLLGMSYGTHLALAFIRRHEARVHRVVMAGTLGPDHALHLPGATDLLLLKVSRLAAQDAGINKLIPDFAALVRQTLAQLEQNPGALSVTDKRTNQPVNVTVGKVALQFTLDGLSDGRTLPTLPALFHSVSRGDYSPLALRVEGLYNSLNGAGSSAMSIAMGCASGWSAERMAKALQEGKQSVAGTATMRRPEFCQAIGSRDLGPEFRSRLWSLAPALFLSGDLDGTTPPYQAEEARWGFPNGVHLIVENGAHETLPAPEAQAIVVDFFNGQDVSGRKVVLPRPRFRTPEELRAR
ncbi:MAG TPA: alpha/beta fold hydrolase [Blastocatellia bacterium]|nr:alpha/beta fold hydrolase [Blastocatellia bacterium]